MLVNLSTKKFKVEPKFGMLIQIVITGAMLLNYEQPGSVQVKDSDFVVCQVMSLTQLRIKSEWVGYQPIDQEEIQPQQGEEWQ